MSEHPAGWYPDPRGRHEYRYWDGSVWTDHVADDGKASTDPVDVVGPAAGTKEESEPVAAETVEPEPERRAPEQAAGAGGLWSSSETASADPIGTGDVAAGEAVESGPSGAAAGGGIGAGGTDTAAAAAAAAAGTPREDDDAPDATPGVGTTPAGDTMPAADTPAESGSGSTTGEPAAATPGAESPADAGTSTTTPGARSPSGAGTGETGTTTTPGAGSPSGAGTGETGTTTTPGAGSPSGAGTSETGTTTAPGAGSAAGAGGASTAGESGAGAGDAGSEVRPGDSAATGGAAAAAGAAAAGGSSDAGATATGPSPGDQAREALRSATATKSPGLAGLLTIAFPGSGHFYLGAGDKRPLAIGLLVATLAAYVLSWFGFVPFVIGFVVWAAAAAYGALDLQSVLKPIREAGAAAASVSPQQVGLVLLAGGILLFVGLFLPWYHLTDASVSVSGAGFGPDARVDSVQIPGFADSGNAFKLLSGLDIVLLVIAVASGVLGATAMGVGPLTGQKLPPWLPTATAAVGIVGLVIVAFRLINVGWDLGEGLPAIPGGAEVDVDADFGRGPGILLSGAATLGIAAAGIVTLIQAPRAKSASRPEDTTSP